MKRSGASISSRDTTEHAQASATRHCSRDTTEPPHGGTLQALKNMLDSRGPFLGRRMVIADMGHSSFRELATHFKTVSFKEISQQAEEQQAGLILLTGVPARPGAATSNHAQNMERYLPSLLPQRHTPMAATCLQHGTQTSGKDTRWKM